MSDQQENNGMKDIFLRVFIPVLASAIVGFSTSYIAMQSELADVKRRLITVESTTDPATKALFTYNSTRIDKVENTIEELRRAINELKNNILPQLAEIRTVVLYIKEDISREKNPAVYRDGGKSRDGK